MDLKTELNAWRSVFLELTWLDSALPNTAEDKKNTILLEPLDFRECYTNATVSRSRKLCMLFVLKQLRTFTVETRTS